MQATSFRALAQLMPIPVYGLSWPKGYAPRAEWPSTLAELSTLFFTEVRGVQPTGPYHLAGHSFGASVALEMARVAEGQGESASLVALLDPRSLPKMEADISGAFAATGLLDDLALLSQTAPDGGKYADKLDEIAAAPKDGQDAAAKKALSAAVLASIEHVHETSQWYSDLLGADGARGSEEPLEFGKIVTLKAAETWTQEPPADERLAEKMVREFQGKTFQSDVDVVAHVASWAGKKKGATQVMGCPGTHFTMLHEPHALTVAMRLCRAVDEADEAAP